MTCHMANKTSCTAILVAFWAILAIACNGPQPTTSGSLNNSRSTLAAAADADNEELDLGQDWASPRARSAAPPPRQAAERGGPRTVEPANRSSHGGWAIALQTFSGANHAEAARTMLRQVPQITPDLAGGIRVHAISSGSVVVYGSYSSQGDPRAAADLRMVRSLAASGRPVYPRAFLIPIDPPAPAAGLRPIDLMSARQMYPNVDPLYTLQVAMWSDFDTGELTLEQIRRGAESHVRALRAERVEAYVHHDEAKRISIVAVGLFGRDAVDVETGLFSAEVEALMRRFPAHLVNGEELREPINPRRPLTPENTRVQPPHLVVVPRQ
jgi:hypothetical protein